MEDPHCYVKQALGKIEQTNPNSHLVVIGYVQHRYSKLWIDPDKNKTFNTIFPSFLQHLIPKQAIFFDYFTPDFKL